MQTTPKEKAPNDIRIGMRSRPKNVIRYASSIMNEKNLKELRFSAVGGSIGKLLDTVEVLKIMIPGLYQQNKITSVAYQTVDSNKTVISQRLYPKLEVILSLEEFPNKNEGTQDKMEEEKRKEIEKRMNERKEQRAKERGNGRVRRGFRGGRRGFEGRGWSRGRGRAPRRGRGGFRDGGRGGFRSSSRGTTRGGSTRGRGNEARVNRGRGTK